MLDCLNEGRKEVTPLLQSHLIPRSKALNKWLACLNCNKWKLVPIAYNERFLICEYCGDKGFKEVSIYTGK